MPMVPIVNQMNLMHATPSSFIRIHFIILSTPYLPSGSLFSDFPTEILYALQCSPMHANALSITYFT